MLHSIIKQCPYAKIIVSGILTRKDVKGIADRVRQTNSIIKSLCTEEKVDGYL
jgi:hypothetical protein